MEIKKGETVIMCGFTGIKLGRFEVESVSAKEVVITKKNGEKAIFSKKTGKQTNAKNEKYANSIIEDDGTYENPLDKKRAAAKKSKKSGTKAKKSHKKDVDEDEDTEEFDDNEDEDEEEPEEKPAKKAKKTAKKSKKAKKTEDDDDDFEELEE